MITYFRLVPASLCGPYEYGYDIDGKLKVVGYCATRRTASRWATRHAIRT